MTSLCLACAVGRPHFHYSKGSFSFCSIDYSLLWNHSPSEWFSLYNNIGLVQTNLWYNWFGWDFSQLVYPRYCISSGLFFWVYMFSTMVGYSAVPKKQRFKALLPAMPTIGLWLTIMIATPVASSLRYVYVLVLLTPLLVVFPALMRRKLADAPDHKPE